MSKLNRIAILSDKATAARARRIARYEAERKRDHTLIEQMIRAFDFTLAGTQTLNGYNVYSDQSNASPGVPSPQSR